MKIIQLVQKPQLRGAEIFASQLSNQLVEMGHEVIMICLTGGTAQLPFAGKIISLNRPLGKRMTDSKGWRQLNQLINDYKPDIIQANAGDTLKFAVLSKLLFRWKTPIVFRNANKVSDFINSSVKRIFNQFLVSQVRHVISVSELCRLDFIHTYGIITDKTTTVPIGIELKSFNPQVPGDLASFFSEGKIIAHAASFVPEKNHMGLIRIVRELIDQGENIRLVLIGDGRLKPRIQELVKELKLEDRILLTGYRTDVLSIISNAHAFVLPSSIEGLPGVILEAMYCRTPVIAYDVGGISEVVKSGDTGWLVKAGDEAGFVSAVTAALHDHGIDRIKENAFRLVTNEFDNRVIAGRFMEAYQKVAGYRLPVAGYQRPVND